MAITTAVAPTSAQSTITHDEISLVREPGNHGWACRHASVSAWSNARSVQQFCFMAWHIPITPYLLILSILMSIGCIVPVPSRQARCRSAPKQGGSSIVPRKLDTYNQLANGTPRPTPTRRASSRGQRGYSVGSTAFTARHCKKSVNHSQHLDAVLYCVPVSFPYPYPGTWQGCHCHHRHHPSPSRLTCGKPMPCRMS